MNNMTLLKGYVSRNFEIRTASSNGKKYAVGNLAVATGTVGPDGKKQYNFLPFKAFAKTAELLEQHIIAGDYVEFTGQLSMNSNYVDKAGKQQYGTMFIAVREFSRLNQRETVKPQVIEPEVVAVAGDTIL